MIQFACEKCGKSFRVGDRLAGRPVKCAGCGRTSLVPGEKVPDNPAPQIHFDCPTCGKRLAAGAGLVGQPASCSGCGELVRVPRTSTPGAPPPAEPIPALTGQVPVDDELVEMAVKDLKEQAVHALPQPLWLPERGKAPERSKGTDKPTPRPRPRSGVSLGNVVALLLTLLIVGGTSWLLVSAISGDGRPGVRGDDVREALLLAGVYTVVIIVVFVPPVMVGRHLGKSRSLGPFIGGLLGILLGWVGVLILLLYPYQVPMKRCPFCAERIQSAARVCKHCQRDLDPGTGS